MKKYINVDGNTATANMAYALSEVATIYPITPSSSMAELADQWANEGKQNIFGNTLTVKEMQSEAGAVGALHGSLACGALSTTFTSSQGLLLMIPNMYKIAGELLPCVFHVSARAIATHALSIFGDHSDVMATRATGFNMICSNSVQQAQDLALVSHLASIDSSLPFIHFFDGFRTSHEIQKIEEISYEDIKKIVNYDNINKFKQRALTPNNPHQQGTAQNPDIFFQNKEASNIYYDKVYNNVVLAMQNVEKITGRHYEPFMYYGDKKATDVIVIMGSGAETCEETIDYLNSQGKHYGILEVHLYRPFNSMAFVEKLPASVKNICVLDRCKENNGLGEPLYVDVLTALNKQNRKVNIIGGRYGLGGKEFTPACVKAVFDNLENAQTTNFSVGINDDVTYLSLQIDEDFEIKNNNVEYKFFGLGSDGTVSANKNTIKIIGEETNKFVQGYFEYDSKKSGSLTISHLRISDDIIKSTYTATHPSFIAIHNFSFLNRYEMLEGLKNNGIVLINTVKTREELGLYLPEKFKQDLKLKNAKLFIINGEKIAEEVGLGNKINVIMQTAFFKLANVISYNDAKEKLISAIKKTYGKKGDAVVAKNISALELAEQNIIEVDINCLQDDYIINSSYSNNEYYQKIIKPIDELQGNKLPVSSMSADGHIPTDTSKYQKRGIASHCPDWNSEKCIQCGMCAMACPHACIRGVLVKKSDIKDKPETFNTASAMAKPEYEYRMQLSPLDCTGCGVCASVCPAKDKALKMVDASSILDKEEQNRNYVETLNKADNLYAPNTVKSLQFKKPYFEYNYACAGCGETPYIKLATQLFGNKMIIANATGCSSIYGGSAPACPYAKDCNGCGPAWANSLFEDNAEFGLGMKYAINTKQNKLRDLINQYLPTNINSNTKNELELWLNGKCENIKNLIELIKNEKETDLKSKILELKDEFTNKSVWIIGGDGWAYDIGYGGLDHLLSSNENVNVLVLDTEVYSNTGGQSSKSTPKGATAKFASGGKQTRKKDLASIAVACKNAYVAQISLGANMQQSIKAFIEAEQYDGPSLIIAYSPCVNHGIDMSNSNLEMKRAVESGYWNLFRYNPENDKLELDSPQPKLDYIDFLNSETRYSALVKKYPEQAKELFEQSRKEAEERYNNLVRLSQK